MTERAREAAARAIMGSTGPIHPDADNILDRHMRTSRHLANAAIDAYIAALWQPIESAPKDGTSVLMWEGGPWVASAFSRDGKFIGWDADSHFLSKPTHWQPITPPAETRTEQT